MFSKLSIITLISLQLVTNIHCFEHDGEGCTKEENEIIEKCKATSKKHADLLAKQNIETDGPDKFKAVAEACKAEVVCMAPIKCKSVREFIDEGTAPSCQWAECSAKLVDKKDKAPCLKEFVFHASSKELAGEELCQLIKKHSDCLKSNIKETCGDNVLAMHTKYMKAMGC